MTRKQVSVVFSRNADKQMKKLDLVTQKKILSFLYDDLPTYPNPKKVGCALRASLRGLWRYRVGDYRIISEMQDLQWVVVVVHVGHRKEVYRDLKIH